MNKILKQKIDKDKYRYFGNNISIRQNFDDRIKIIKAYRKANFYRNRKYIKYIYFYHLKKICQKQVSQIPYNVTIGDGFYIGHIGNIIMNPNVIIGRNVNIANGVCIGQENRGNRKGTPTIGNKVWIGTNAVIVGKIKIGNNVLIAPNSYINFDVPDNSIVVGNPGKIIYNGHATENYINNII